MSTCKFTRNNYFTHLLHVFCLHTLGMRYGYFFRRGFESVRALFLSGNISQKVVLLVIYLFNYDSSKATFLMLNMAFDVLLSTALSKKLEFFVSFKNIKITKTSLFFALCFGMYFFSGIANFRMLKGLKE